MKICADRVSVELSYDANFKSKAEEHIQMMHRYALDFFPRNALGDGPAFWIFPGFIDKG